MVYYGFSPDFIFSYLSTGQETGWKERLRYDTVNQKTGHLTFVRNFAKC